MQEPGNKASYRDRVPIAKEGLTLTQLQVHAIGRALAQARGPGRLGFECAPFGCICSGDDDCNDMFGSGVCGDGICFEDGAGGVVCICVRN